MSDLSSFFAGLLALVPGLATEAPPSWNGYVEADYVYVAPASGGTITTLAVKQGQWVEAGAVLLAMEDGQQRAALRAAEARVAAARANAENLASGSRDEEVEVIRASLAKAEADRDLAHSQAERSAKLLVEGVVPQAKADADRASALSAEAQVAQLRAQLKVAELPARDPQRLAAEANLQVAEADADQARAVLADRQLSAPLRARVERIYFDAGEVAGAGTPVVALQPVEGLKVKFYLPEAQRPQITLGDRVQVGCDGCAEGIEAEVSFLAAEPQFTPPVIYSRDERNRLTFLAEATLPGGTVLPPGQPVTVRK